MYDIGRSHDDMSGWLEAMRSIPRLGGFKVTNESAYQFALLKQCSDGRLNILAGADQTYLGCRTQGADGGIGTTYNIALPVWRRIDELFVSGQAAAASRLMMQCAELLGHFCSGHFLAIVKAILRREGIECGTVRPPLAPDVEPGEEVIDRLHDSLQALRSECTAGVTS